MATDHTERLHKVLAQCGVASRRKAEDLIRAGRVTVNGEVAHLGQAVDLTQDAVKVDGRRVQAPRRIHHYLLLHKPPGYVSTRSDPEGRPTVLDLVPAQLRSVVLPVGRLDFDSEGLLLLTDDGDFSHRVSHPRFGCLKTYAVKVKGHPETAAIARLRRGIWLDGQHAVPVKVVARQAPPGPRGTIENTWWTVVLNEGRTRQIREMFHRIGHPVCRLRRVAIGPLTLSALPRGHWRQLTEQEIDGLRQPQPPPKSSRSSGTRSSGTRPSGTQPSGTRPSGTRPSGTRPSGTRPSGTRPSGTRPSGTRPSEERQSKERPSKERQPARSPQGRSGDPAQRAKPGALTPKTPAPAARPKTRTTRTTPARTGPREQGMPQGQSRGRSGRPPRAGGPTTRRPRPRPQRDEPR